jgi:DNA-directed RNA polymerase specialized sigma24 family protein
MTAKHVLNKLTPCDLETMAGSAFITALLLAGSMERAEAAVLEGITSLNPDDISDGPLFTAAVLSASVTQQTGGLEEHMEIAERTSSILPLELRKVLHLPPPLRRCFVLRMLAGLPREVCARLLHLEVQQVDERTCAALPMLSII